MQSFTFQTARSVLVEPGSSGRLGELFSNLGCRTVLVVTDKGVRDAGLLEAALRNLSNHGVNAIVFADVLADPPDEIVRSALSIADRNGIDGVAGLGGGSSLDVAKLVALLHAGQDKLDDIYGVGLAKGPRLPLILVPTTAGTGSEVTPIAIVTTSTGEKKGVVSPVLLPDWAVLDADLTLGLPSHVTAATGIDAMVHAIEAYTSRRLKNPVSDALACEALRLLSANIREACHNGTNQAARHSMLLGSMLAGMAFANAPVAAVHALAYPVGARFHVPHGLSNALVLPHVLRFNAPAAQELYASLAEILVPDAKGSASDKTEAFIQALETLPRTLGLPTRLSEAGIEHPDLGLLAEDAMKQTRLLINNPREVRLEDALAIYKKAL